MTIDSREVGLGGAPMGPLSWYRARSVDLNVKDGVAFIHIPKNAGRTIRHHMGLEGTTHAPASWFKGKRIEFKFCFVRNPYTRLVSLYHHYLHNPKADKLSLTHLKWNLRHLKYFKTFCNFMRNFKILSIEEGLEYEDIVENPPSIDSYIKLEDQLGYDKLPFNFRPQSYWVDEEIDFIGKVENLESDFKKLDKINRNIFGYEFLYDKDVTLQGKTNQLNDVNHMDLYDTESIKIVNEIYKDDFEKFNYRML